MQDQDYVFAPFGLDPDLVGQALTFDLTFLGYGIDYPERGMNDCRGIDVKGKVVIALFGAPWETEPLPPHMPDRAVGKLASAGLHNAESFIYVTDLDNPNPEPETPFLRPYGSSPAVLRRGEQPACAVPTLLISPKVFDASPAKVTGATHDEWLKKIAEKGSLAFPIDAAIEIEIQSELEEAWPANVVDILPGTDTALSDESVVMLAHYDHIGTLPVGEGEDGICNGADDNASGTAAVLEVARLLAAGDPPKRSVVALLNSAWG